MLLPAVQSVREAARRTQCLNNLRQIGIACHNFETANKEFPTAGGAVNEYLISNAQSANFSHESYSWMYQILPFIEQTNTFNLVDSFAGSGAPPLVSGAAERTIEGFNCASRDNRFAIWGANILALGDYAGVIGNSNTYNGQTFEWQSANVNFAEVKSEEDVFWTGILVKGGQADQATNPPSAINLQRVGFRDIFDGSSNTILIAEKSVSTQDYTVDISQFWRYWEIYGYYTGADWPIMRQFGAPTEEGNDFLWPPIADGASPRTAQAGEDSNGNPIWQEQGFGSPHPGVFNAVLGDASTRAIPIGADLNLLEDLGARADGEIATTDDL